MGLPEPPVVPDNRQVTDLFGRMVSAAEIEIVIREVLRRWINIYLGEMELQLGHPQGSWPRPRSYMIANSFDNFVENQLPTITIVSPGLAERPIIEGDGTVSGIWEMSVGVVASAMDQESTNNLVKVYCAAIRGIMEQQRGLGGWSWGTDWINESYREIPSVDSRTFAGGLLTFYVYVDNVVNRVKGPYSWPGVDPEPGDNYYVALDVIIRINNYLVEQDLQDPPDSQSPDWHHTQDDIWPEEVTP